MAALDLEQPEAMPFHWAAATRQLSLYVVGKPGTGKSTLLRSIAYDDMVEGAGLCFIDPHEDAVNDLLEHIPSHRLDDLIVWDPTKRSFPFGLNPFACSDDDDIDARADNFLAVLGSLGEFQQTFSSAPRMKSVLKHLAIAFLVNQGYSLAETPEFLTDQTVRHRFYPELAKSYPQVLRFWQRFDQRPEREQREMTDSSLNKLERFQIDRTMRGIFGQPSTAIDFRAAMDEGKIILVKLARHKLGDDNASFLGAFIVWEILQAALSRSDTPESQRRQFHVFADEFQTFMTSAFPRLIMECRKFGVDVVVAHQARGQLDDATRKTTMAISNKIVFGVSGEDANELVNEFEITIPEPHISGYRPRYALASKVLDHIGRNGHEDHEVVTTYRDLKDRLNHLYPYYSEYLSEPAKQSQVIDDGIEMDLDEILYLSMSSGVVQEESNLIGEIYNILARHILPIRFPTSYHNAMTISGILPFIDHRVEVDPSRTLARGHDRFSYIDIPQVAGYDGPTRVLKPVWDFLILGYQTARYLASSTRRLCLLLKQSPALVQTGQLDPIYDRPRLHSDVQLEMANELATLRR